MAVKKKATKKKAAKKKVAKKKTIKKKVPLEDRKRKIDVEKLSEEQLQKVETTLVKKIAEINDEASEKINKLVEAYGLKAVVQMRLLTLDEYTKLQKSKQTQSGS